jgi:polyisoprenoid-binding protein YceI
MRKKLIRIIILFSTFLFFPFVTYAADTFTLDPNHSYVLWHINHFGFSSPSGKWLAEGTLVLDKEKPQNDKVNVVINVANVVTGIKELDDHLRGQQFFNTAAFPKAMFVSDNVSVTGKDSANVQGILTVHGVSKPVTLKVKFNKAGISIITNKMTVGFSATTNIKRSDFGMNRLLPGLGDEVRIDIELEAVKNN